MNKKILIGSIIAVLMLLLPVSTGISELNIPQDELPDLSIRYIYFYSRIPQWGDYILKINIKNKGKAIVNESIQTRVIMKRFLIGLPIIPTISSTVDISFNNGIKPGEDEWRGFDKFMPRFSGLYLVIVNINCDKKLIESNYLNNRYIGIYLRGLTFWYP